MTNIDKKIHTQCVNRFIDLANAMKDEGIEIQVVSHALMSASGIYTTYALGGNEGGLTASGVDKVSAVFKQELERIQESRKQSSVK
jgi:hypothetical protein